MAIPQTYENPEGLATSTLKKRGRDAPGRDDGQPLRGRGPAGVHRGAVRRRSDSPRTVGTGPAAARTTPSSATVRIQHAVDRRRSDGFGRILAEPAPLGEAGRTRSNRCSRCTSSRGSPSAGCSCKAPGEVRRTRDTAGSSRRSTPRPSTESRRAGCRRCRSSLFTFSFNQGATAPLVTPPACGDYTVHGRTDAVVRPGRRAAAPLIPPFPIDTQLPVPAASRRSHRRSLAGTLNNARAPTARCICASLATTANRRSQGSRRSFPPGLTGNLSGVPYARKRTSKRRGTGPGAEEEQPLVSRGPAKSGIRSPKRASAPVLVQTPGKIYLGGARTERRARSRSSAITSAKVGPFDLGTVVIHLPLDINPETAAGDDPGGSRGPDPAHHQRHRDPRARHPRVHRP